LRKDPLKIAIVVSGLPSAKSDGNKSMQPFIEDSLRLSPHFFLGQGHHIEIASSMHPCKYPDVRLIQRS